MNPCAWNVCVLVCALLCMPISGCSEPTVGQQFRDIMAEIDAKCRMEGLGPYLSPGEPPGSRKRTDGSCEILKIKPVDPLATEEGRFAYSLKLPPPHDKPKVEYKKGMSAEAYFKELCEKEEGDFVFRMVERVEGIQILRPMSTVTGVDLWDEVGAPSPGFFVDQNNGLYKFVDAFELINRSATKTQLVHYFIDPRMPQGKPPYGEVRLVITKSRARYGFTYRNSPLENRELGIKGGELILLDLETNEVLGLRRFFAKLQFIKPLSAQVMQSTPCRLLGAKDSNNRFIARILKPVAPTKRGDK